MKSFFVVGLLWGSLALAGEFHPKMLLADLPDGALLQVHHDLELGTSTYQPGRIIHHVAFDQGETQTGTDIADLRFPFFTWMVLRTDSEAALDYRTVSGLFSNYGAYFLKAGKYCLNKKLSNLPIRNSQGLPLDQDRLFFVLCETGQPAFAIYTNAGLGMNQRQKEHRFRVGRFHYHAGEHMNLVR